MPRARKSGGGGQPVDPDRPWIKSSVRIEPDRMDERHQAVLRGSARFRPLDGGAVPQPRIVEPVKPTRRPSPARSASPSRSKHQSYRDRQSSGSSEEAGRSDDSAPFGCYSPAIPSTSDTNWGNIASDAAVASLTSSLCASISSSYRSSDVGDRQASPAVTPERPLGPTNSPRSPVAPLYSSPGLLETCSTATSRWAPRASLSPASAEKRRRSVAASPSSPRASPRLRTPSLSPTTTRTAHSDFGVSAEMTKGASSETTSSVGVETVFDDEEILPQPTMKSQQSAKTTRSGEEDDMLIRLAYVLANAHALQD